MSTVQALKEVGEAMGLTGADLQQFIKEQQQFEREERQQQRQWEKEQRDAERDKEKEQRDAERDKELRQLDQVLQLAQLAMEKDLELAKMEQEQRDKDRAFELDRINAEIELRKIVGDKKEEELEDEEENEEKQGGKQQPSTSIKGPKMPPFDETRDNMDSFLHRFEIYAAAQKWKSTQWAVFLSALLKGKALDVYSRLPVDEANDYDLLKSALLKRFDLTEEGFKKKFKTAQAEQNEAPAQFITRLGSYFTKWVELSGVTKTFKGLSDMIIRDQFIETCPEELALFLKERAERDLDKLAKLAEQYTDAHTDRSQPSNIPSNRPYTRSYKAAAMQQQQYTGQRWNGSQRGFRQTTSRGFQGCYRCGKGGHIAKNCRSRLPTAAMQFGGQRRGRGYGNRGNFNNVQRSGDNGTIQEGGTEPQGNDTHMTCRAHMQEKCSQCFNLPNHVPHNCGALLAADNIRTNCGCILPVIADACNLTAGRVGENMPVAEGKLGDRIVSVLRDTGCSTVVVRRSLINEDQLTGAERTCVLIDGTIRKTPVAEIDIDTPFFKGRVAAVCMRRPLYDIILGNIPGARDLPANWRQNDQPQEQLAAVITRSQAAKPKVDKTLTVPKRQDINVSKDELRTLQLSDETLKPIWKKAEDKVEITSRDKTVTIYIVKQGLLHRKRLTVEKQESFQLVVPEKLRKKVLAIAHDSILGGHQGIRRTYDRVIEAFIWPGLHGDVTRYCRSCDICQRTVSRGRVASVPLGRMPLIDTPFQRVAVDLVGPMKPATERGHRYIVTLVDYATRYPEATPLKDITTETVAEALVTMFSRIGIPREILSDQGSQFMSGIMKEISRLLSMQQLVTTPYHPICNGLVERFNGTLKKMLKRMCAERPKDWDRYIAPLLFAYREVPQESLGFSPFQLLYGRSVRGPMMILKELWTEKNPEPEVKITYQYVLDLQDRLQQTCQLARDELLKAKEKQRRYYNKRTKDRKFKQGDKVLLLLPNNENKLLMQWQGPFTVVERTNTCDYRIQLPGRVRLFHANMLKRYYDRESQQLEIRETTCAAIVEPETGDDCQLDLYTEIQTEDYRDVDINPDLNEERKNELRTIVQEFQDVFTDVPKVTNLGVHEINLTTDEPIRSKPYPLPYAMREVVDKEITTMLRLGIIEQSTAPYASPIVMVRKPDGSNRICIDFRKLNKITVVDPEPMPQADEIFAKLVDSNFFSKFDLSKGYWQVAMNPEDRDITTFVTHSGLYRFRVMPFGLVNAPATFSRIMRKLLRGAKQLENYLDDVLAHAKTWEQHLQEVRDFLMRVRKANLTVRPSKCAFGYSSINFLGHTVGSQTIRPNTKTAQRITESARPTTKKQLRSFLGLAGYYRRFVPDFAAIAVPLTDLTKKGSANLIPWGEPQERAFAALKAHIARSPILRLPDLNSGFILQTDASNEGIGAVLLQEVAGIKHPICFISRKLLPREKNYSTIERECLAIVWGIQKFELYLYGKTFILETDHQPLQYVRRAQFKNGRLMRWALALQPYNFIVHAIKGSDNVGADFLSRCV